MKAINFILIDDYVVDYMEIPIKLLYVELEDKSYCKIVVMETKDTIRVGNLETGLSTTNPRHENYFLNDYLLSGFYDQSNNHYDVFYYDPVYYKDKLERFNIKLRLYKLNNFLTNED